MSMITEQVEYLIKLSNKHTFESNIPTLQRACKEAANTIEQLAAKVRAANMERSTAYYNGGWIPVKERLPEDEQEILFSTKTGRVHSGKYHDDDSANQWYSHKDKCRAWNNVVSAWMPLPKPYEPQERNDKK